MSKELLELVPLLCQTRSAKGWNTNTWEMLGVRIASLYTEAVELELGIDEQGMRYACAELADICMYTLTMLEDLWPGAWTVRSPARQTPRPTYRHPALLLQPLRVQIRAVYEYWRRGEQRDTKIALEHVLLECVYLARDHHIELVPCIRRKLEVNVGRPTLHGNKNPWT